MKKIKDIAGNMVRSIRSGDKVIWLIVVILIMLSLVAIFSSTSMMAVKKGVSRTDIFLGQLAIVLVGIVLLLIFTALPNMKRLRALSKTGFIVSLFLLLFLDMHGDWGKYFRAVTVNSATRAIYCFGFTLQVYEVVKVAMVMYLAWAIQTYSSGKFNLTNKLGMKYPAAFGWMKDEAAQRWIYLFIPFLTTVALIFPGSTGSAILTGAVLFITMVIGGVRWKHLVKLIAVGAAGVFLLVSAHVMSNGEFVPRLQTFFNRMKIELPYPNPAAKEKQMAKIAIKNADPSTLKPGTKEFAEYIDEILQPMAAEVAIVEGGRSIFGKGPGKSTQKYVVPVIFEDYMFSLIVEEYGLLMGILIIVMYLSLFARGMTLVMSVENRYAKTCVGGLVFLITFQALFHILINCNIGILTGQTLPLISHGKCSFLCFIIAFGVILCISKMANEKLQAEQQKAMMDLANSEKTEEDRQ